MIDRATNFPKPTQQKCKQRMERMPSPKPPFYPTTQHHLDNLTKLQPKTAHRESSPLDHEVFAQKRPATKEWSQSEATALAGSTGAPSEAGLEMDIISQGKCLCGQYIRARLRRAGVLNRKATKRLRSILEHSSDVVYEVFPALNSMGEELERMHPRLYTNVARQLSLAPFGELVDSDTAPRLLNLLAKDLFSSSITWGKIISIFAVCGGFAIDCVRQGHYDYLQFLADGLAEIIENDLVLWLTEQGGWTGLLQHIRPTPGQFSFLAWLTVFVTVASCVHVISNFIRLLSGHLYSLLF